MLWVLCPPSKSYGASQNDSRARTLSIYANRYWPRETVVRAWLRENWDEWADPLTRPKWFKQKWRNLFPEEWLPSPVADDLVMGGGKKRGSSGFKRFANRLFSSSRSSASSRS